MPDQPILGHIGITVTDIDRTFQFYKKFFGFKYVRGGTFDENFFVGRNALYRQPAGATGRYAFISSADGMVFELFEFSPAEAFEPANWSRPGYHHICIKVPDMKKTMDAMKADGTEFFFPPVNRGDPMHGLHWVFLKDPDGNYLELHD